jgi:hypothetical protein
MWAEHPSCELKPGPQTLGLIISWTNPVNSLGYYQASLSLVNSLDCYQGLCEYFQDY